MDMQKYMEVEESHGSGIGAFERGEGEGGVNGNE